MLSTYQNPIFKYTLSEEQPGWLLDSLSREFVGLYFDGEATPAWGLWPYRN